MQDMKITVNSPEHSEAIQKAWLADGHAPVDGINEYIPNLDYGCFLYLDSGVISWNSDLSIFNEEETPEFVFENGEFRPAGEVIYESPKGEILIVHSTNIVDAEVTENLKEVLPAVGLDLVDPEPVPEVSRTLSKLFTLNEAPYSGRFGHNALKTY